MRLPVLPVALTVAVVLWAASGRSPRPPARARVPSVLCLRGSGCDAGCSESSGPAEAPAGKAAAPGVVVAAGIDGVVVDADGAPVAGVAVCAEFGHVGTGRGGFPQGTRDGESRTTTDGAGRFTLDAPASARWAVVNVDAVGWVEPEPRVARLGSGTHVIRAPRREAWQAVASPPRPREEEIPADARAMGLVVGEGWPHMRIVLERGERIEGTVETGAGIAVPGAAITARWRDALPGWRALEARSDPSGRFAILVSADALVTAARAEAVGNGRELVRDPQAWAWPVRGGTSDLRLVLQEPVGLELRVRNSPIPLWSASVSATPASFPGPCEWLLGARSLHIERVGDDGALRVFGLLPGISDLVIQPPGPNRAAAHGRASAPGDAAVIEWPAEIAVDGVLEGEDIEDFKITWMADAPADGFRESGSVVRIGTTAWPPGRLLVDPPGCFRLFVAGPGTICARRAGDPRCAWAPAFDPSRGFLRLSLARGRAIRGSAEGRPGMVLSALRVRAVAGPLSEEAGVNDDGTFEIVGLPPLAFRVELRSGEWLHDARDDVPAGAEGVRFRVRIPATDPDGGGS